MLILTSLVNNISQKPVKITEKLLLTLILKINMIFKNNLIFNGIYKMDLPM